MGKKFACMLRMCGHEGIFIGTNVCVSSNKICTDSCKNQIVLRSNAKMGIDDLL